MNMLKKIKVHINLEMDSCKCICSNMHRQNFVNAVAHLSRQVTKIFPNAQIENNMKLRILEVRTRQRRDRVCGRGRRKRDRYDRGGGRGRDGSSGGGHDGNPDRP